MDTINAAIKSGNYGQAWQLAEEFEGRSMTYIEFLSEYIWD